MESFTRFVAITGAFLLLGGTAVASPGDHPLDDCKSDTECVDITTLSQGCHHIDPKAKDACPVVNRKYKVEITSVDCFRSVPCKPNAAVWCRNGTCAGAADQPPTHH